MIFLLVFSAKFWRFGGLNIIFWLMFQVLVVVVVWVVRYVAIFFWLMFQQVWVVWGGQWLDNDIFLVDVASKVMALRQAFF